MADKGLKVRDLVKATGLPQTTISSILKGKSKHPRGDTLKTLADLFGLTIEQLVGHEALKVALPSTASKRNTPLTIPLIQWHEVKPWISGQCDINVSSIWILNGICKNPKAFALKAKPSMQSHFFFPNVTLLVDPQASMQDGLNILVFLEGSKEPSLRLITIDGEEKWLNSLDKDKPAVKLNPKHSIVGPVVEVRYNPSIK